MIIDKPLIRYFRRSHSIHLIWGIHFISISIWRWYKHVIRESMRWYQSTHWAVHYSLQISWSTLENSRFAIWGKLLHLGLMSQYHGRDTSECLFDILVHCWADYPNPRTRIEWSNCWCDQRCTLQVIGVWTLSLLITTLIYQDRCFHNWSLARFKPFCTVPADSVTTWTHPLSIAVSMYMGSSVFPVFANLWGPLRVPKSYFGLFNGRLE